MHTLDMSGCNIDDACAALAGGRAGGGADGRTRRTLELVATSCPGLKTLGCGFSPVRITTGVGGP